MTPAGETPRRVMFPAQWADAKLDGFVGSVAFERRFGFPGRIDAHERVWLVGQGMAGPANISLQGELLGTITSGRFAFEVTPRLRDRNLLQVTLGVDASRTDLWDDIALEVRATAYLEDVTRDGLSVRGRVTGTCEGPLEIYVLAGDRRCGYRQVAAGEAFDVEIEPADGPMRVELIQVSTVWYVVELDPSSQAPG